jgi:phosphoenolpyruvate carboxykinase (ATP)
MSTMMTRAHDLASEGLINLGNVHWNLSVPQLIEQAIIRHEAVLAANGAITAETGKRTGRSPKDKFIVRHGESANSIWWGNNQPISPEHFERLWNRATAYLQGRDIFVLDAWAGAHPDYRIPIRVVAELAWHALFAQQLFCRMSREEIAHAKPQWLVLAVPYFYADPERDGTRSEVAVILDFEMQRVLIAGTRYAGEIKKSIFTMLNYVLPARGVFPMHCSANTGADGRVALFFGLSGTGKTSLSADPERPLIGDDEHGWSDQGIFNFEGGCYAKCIRLSEEREPQIWHAIRFGAVCENVVLDPRTRIPDYDDDTLTENTRAAYPVENIPHAVLSGIGGQPAAIFLLTADAFGVMPPIALLTTEQAMYYFLSGYTAKLAGTEAGLSAEPEATFSTCFAAPFLPLPPTTYSRMMRERIERHQVRCFLVNTGWIGGPFGVGKRINIEYTRAMVRAAINGDLDQVERWTDPIFGLHVPVLCPGVPAEVLRPRDTWANPDDYDRQARELARRFIKNAERFPDADPGVHAAGPHL